MTKGKDTVTTPVKDDIEETPLGEESESELDSVICDQENQSDEDYTQKIENMRNAPFP